MDKWSPPLEALAEYLPNEYKYVGVNVRGNITFWQISEFTFLLNLVILGSFWGSFLKAILGKIRGLRKDRDNRKKKGGRGGT